MNLVHPKAPSEFFGAISYVVGKLVGVKEQSTQKPMPILVLCFPNPRTNTPRNDVEILSVTNKSGQDHHPLFLVSGIFNLVRHQRLHHHRILDVYCRLGKTMLHLVGKAGKRQ
jgi:hypothetical protein